VGLDLGVAPLVACPIGMAIVVVSARVVRNLLHNFVALVHVELVTATESREALGVAIPISVLADRMPRHTDQVEVQIATARWPVALEINIHAERLPREDRHVEIVSVAVICGWPLHEVESVWRGVPHSPPTINSRGARKVVSVIDSILIDDDGACLCPHERLSIFEEGFAVQREAWSW